MLHRNFIHETDSFNTDFMSMSMLIDQSTRKSNQHDQRTNLISHINQANSTLGLFIFQIQIYQFLPQQIQYCL